MDSDTKLKERRIPAGPQAAFRSSDDLFGWMGRQFEIFGDIYRASLRGTTVYVIRDAALANHVLVDNWQNYAKGWDAERIALLTGNGLIVSEGDLWKRQRRMIQPAFSHEPIGASTQLIRTVNLRLLAKWQLAAERNASVNVTHDVSAMALEVVLRYLLGDDYEQVGHHFDLLTQEQARTMTFARSFRPLGRFILQVIERRRKESATSTDALGMMMRARDPQSGQGMDDRQLVDEILTLIVAGHETTASTLNWVWYLISQHPEVERKLSCELKDAPPSPDFDDLPRFGYTRQIIEETMRLYPALWFWTRKALHHDWLSEYFVPAGTEILLATYFIHRHPDVWEKPDCFEPDRLRPENSKCRHRLATIPFGAGPRICIGAPFARLEMQIHLMTIAGSLRLRYVQSGPMEVEAGVNLRSKHDFIMYPQPKDASPSESFPIKIVGI